MKLEKIVLNGFKSFADKTEFKFDDGITAIVGPNGCGKSNVVDALKWVLGNQSPKSLRSGSMTDVIFSGSGSRKASSMAEVSLSFSEVVGMGLEQDELTITRRLYKNGDSEYLINNNSCRLKDIREMFMDTGIGVSAYSIIEQGQIDQLLHASKTDRRVIFEEAAGISKFKAHKKEAIRKLGRTEQNLLRLADIVSEVQKQLRSIKLQAGKARNYLEYSDKLKELRVKYSLAEYDKITTQRKARNESLGEFRTKFGAVVTEVAKSDTAISEMNKTILETDGEISRCDNSLISAKGKIEQQLERIDFLKSRIDELAGRKVSAAEQIKKLDGHSKQFTNELYECKKQIEENETIFEEKNSRLGEVQEVIDEINHQCGGIDAELQDEKSGIIDIVRKTAHLHNEIQSMGTYRERMSGQVDRLSGRASEAEKQLGGLLTEKAMHNAKLGDVLKVIEELQESLEAKRKQIEENNDEQALANSKISVLKENRSGLRSEHKVLEDMEAKGQGLSGAIKHILRAQAEGEDNRYDYVDGIVADIINADVEYAGAVEAALEGKTDALVINSTSKFLADSEIQSKLDSRVNVICRDKVGPFTDTKDFSSMPSVIGRVIEFVNFDSKYDMLVWDLLGHTLLVDSMDTAMRLSGELGGKYRFITAGGEVFDGGSSMRVGPVGKTVGLISRKSRLGQLEREIASASLEVGEIEESLKLRGEKNDHLAKLCKDFRTSIYEANTEKVDSESKIRLLEQNIKRLTDEQPVIASEIAMIEEEISESVQKEHDSKEKLVELEDINKQRTEKIEELEGQIAERREMAETHTMLLTELKVEVGQISEQRRSINQRIASLQSQMQHSRMALESARTDLLGCDDQILQTERNILQTTSSVSELFVVKESAQRMSIAMHKKAKELLAEQQRVTELLREKRSEQSNVEQKMHEVELDLSQLNVKFEDLTVRVKEELGIDLAEAYENFEQEDTDWDAVREEINMLRTKISRLGNVNVDAIDEQKELEERNEFLTSQVEDLNESKGQLEELIDKINKQSVEKFRVTFEEVRKNFQVLFRKLFGGGKADIILEDPDDILECGIEIVARPPGKETRSISLLSGGEKTMTALGLLFSVFRSKPSPFCILDEVDAALDEANNERFNMIVKEFKKDSQFVTITHSKRTMSIADILFGVTMQTQGVSKKISVKFDSPEMDAAVA